MNDNEGLLKGTKKNCILTGNTKGLKNNNVLYILFIMYLCCLNH